MFFRFVHPSGTNKDRPLPLQHHLSENKIHHNINQPFQNSNNRTNLSNNKNVQVQSSNINLQKNKKHSSESRLFQIQNPQRIVSKQMKSLLTQSYQKSIKQKKQQRLSTNRQKIMEQKDYLSQFQNHKEFQLKRNNKIRQEYKKQLLTEIKQKTIVLNLIKTQQTQIDKIFQEPRQYSLRNKSLAFKKFYQEAGNNQKIVENQYRNYMKQEQKYVLSRNKHKISDYEKNYDLMRKHRQQDIRLSNLKKEELRNVLDTQIKAKQRKFNKSKQMQFFKRSGSLKNIYHPIINPIDFKMDVNNKYVIKQLAKRVKNIQN